MLPAKSCSALLSFLVSLFLFCISLFSRIIIIILFSLQLLYFFERRSIQIFHVRQQLFLHKKKQLKENTVRLQVPRTWLKQHIFMMNISVYFHPHFNNSSSKHLKIFVLFASKIRSAVHTKQKVMYLIVFAFSSSLKARSLSSFSFPYY